MNRETKPLHGLMIQYTTVAVTINTAVTSTPV